MVRTRAAVAVVYTPAMTAVARAAWGCIFRGGCTYIYVYVKACVRE